MRAARRAWSRRLTAARPRRGAQDPTGPRRRRRATTLLNEARILLAVPPHPALPLVREDFFDAEDYVVAMDWVDGTDLARLLQDRGRPGPGPVERPGLSVRRRGGAHPPARPGPAGHPRRRQARQPHPHQGRPRQAGRFWNVVGAQRTATPHAARPATGRPSSPPADRRAGPATSTPWPPRRSPCSRAPRPPGVLPEWEGIDPEQADQLEAAIRMGMTTDPARRPATPGEFVERLRAGWAEALPTGVVTFCMSDIEGSTRDVGGRADRRWPRRSCVTTS